MKEYMKPELEVLKFKVMDVVTTSGEMGGDIGGGDGSGDSDE